jgi:hypothetical protein
MAGRLEDQNSVVIDAAAAAGRFVTGGYTTIYDGVVGPWFLPRFVQSSGLEELDYLILLPSVDRCVQRVAARTGHGFSDADATRKMWAQSTTPRSRSVTSFGSPATP